MPEPRTDFLTATDFYRYFQCPHWPYWERFGDPKDRRPLTETEEQRLADGLEHEREIVERMFPASEEVEAGTLEDAAAKTLELMRLGVPVIYQGVLQDGEWRGKPDILERQEGQSALGGWYYVPLDIKRAHELKKEHLAQLTFYAVLLERIQGRFPAEPAIVNADGQRLPFQASEFLSEFKEIAEKIERIRAGELPAPVYRKACSDTSPWEKACFRLAKERDDIALLFNVDIKKLEALRKLGIRTVEDAADMDPTQYEGMEPGLTLRGLQAAQRQARSLREESVIVKKPYVPQTVGLEIHFDIESHPPTDTDYLYGFWIVEQGEGRTVAFVSESPEGEKKMWKEFLAWLELLPSEYTVYHYAAYEQTRLGNLAERYGDTENAHLAKFRSRFVDLKELAREHVVFPLYFYSLKKICQFLGFHWEGEVTGGAQSIMEFDQWMKTGDRTILDSIIQYNREDVQATAFLLAWLERFATAETAYRKPYPWAALAKPGANAV